MNKLFTHVTACAKEGYKLSLSFRRVVNVVQFLLGNTQTPGNYPKETVLRIQINLLSKTDVIIK
jgi:hypothetical protein